MSLFPNLPSSSYTHSAAGRHSGGRERRAGGMFVARPTLLMIHSCSFVLLYVARRESCGGLSDHLKHAHWGVKPRWQEASRIVGSQSESRAPFLLHGGLTPLTDHRKGITFPQGGLALGIQAPTGLMFEW